MYKRQGYYIVSGGGKRIRPMIAVLAARAVGYEGNAHVTIAAPVSYTHLGFVAIDVTQHQTDDEE